jgi:hypothetical protein
MREKFGVAEDVCVSRNNDYFCLYKHVLSFGHNIFVYIYILTSIYLFIYHSTQLSNSSSLSFYIKLIISTSLYYCHWRDIGEAMF